MVYKFENSIVKYRLYLYKVHWYEIQLSLRDPLNPLINLFFFIMYP